MKRQTNLYILVFTAIMTLVLGGLLSLTSVVLKPAQTIQEELDTKKKIIGAVMDVGEKRSDNDYMLALNEKHFSSIVIDYQGNIKELSEEGTPFVAERINIQKNHKIDPDMRYAPVFLFKEDPSSEEPTAYVFPTFGAGLWDWISGYIAIEADLNTVKGVSFDHKSETPGLGARITSDLVRNRYQGKHIFDENGALISVNMVKGETGKPLDLHHIDGMSGATMTGKGVNKMFKDYSGYYLNYIQAQKQKHSQPNP